MTHRLSWMPVGVGLLGLAGLALMACGGADAPDVKGPDSAPTGTPTAEATAAPTATAQVAPTATASATSEVPALPAAKNDEDGADGIRRWVSFNGPKTGTAVTTKRAWVIAPNTMASGEKKLSFSSVALVLADVVSSSPTETVFELNKNKYAVSSALVRPAEAPKGLKKGTIARCAFGGSNMIGRIEAADAKQVTCALRFLERTEKAKIAPEEVFALDGKISTGAAAIVKFESDMDVSYEAWVVAASGDDVWVSVKTNFGLNDPRGGHDVHKVKASNVTWIDPSKPLKVGDACLATEIARIMPCKVTKVIDGLAYTVSFEGNGPTTMKEWGLDQIAPAPKAAAPKAPPSVIGSRPQF